MARMRKTKVGIEYFSHDVDMFADPNIELLFAAHGLVGYGLYNRLLEKIYQDKGYYLQTNDEINILIAKDVSLELGVYLSILNDCVLRDLFDKKLFAKYKILTSPRMQENYLMATVRRKEIKLVKEYILIDLTEFCNINIVKLSDIGNHKEEIEEIEESEESEESENTEKIKCSDVINYLNEVLGTRYPVTNATRSRINARMNEDKKLTIDDFKLVIHKKYNEWHVDPKMSAFLRPETLFGTKFASYLNAPAVNGQNNQSALQALKEKYKEADNEEDGND